MARQDEAGPARFSPQPMEGEPFFNLLARDPHAPALLRQWADDRREAVRTGERNEDDLRAAQRADEIADAMVEWRKVHDGEWRLIPPEEAVRAQYNEGT